MDRKLLMLALSIAATPAVANELEIRAQLGAMNGHVSNITGLHANPLAPAGPPVPVTIELLDNKFATSAAIGADLNYFWPNNWGFNAGISSLRLTTRNTGLVYKYGGAVVATTQPGTFPPMTVSGAIVSAGPVYRWKDASGGSKLAPYIGLNLSALLGSQNNTNYNPNNNPLLAPYGVGGPSTHVGCYGLTPRAGISYDVGTRSTLSIEYRYTAVRCNNGPTRSLQWGYKVDAVINALMLGYGWKF